MTRRSLQITNLRLRILRQVTFKFDISAPGSGPQKIKNVDPVPQPFIVVNVFICFVHHFLCAVSSRQFGLFIAVHGGRRCWWVWGCGWRQGYEFKFSSWNWRHILMYFLWWFAVLRIRIQDPVPFWPLDPDFWSKLRLLSVPDIGSRIHKQQQKRLLDTEVKKYSGSGSATLSRMENFRIRDLG